jgi:hypothetical protein
MRELTAHQILVDLLESWLLKNVAMAPVQEESHVDERHLTHLPCDAARNRSARVPCRAPRVLPETD